MHAFLENFLIMILSVVVPLTVAYLFLLLIGWGLKMKSGGHEQQGLTDMWIAAQSDLLKKKTAKTEVDDDPPT